ncbi:MAG: hypothetical protein AAFP69_17275, partial [Planctomycetota bacterium]
MQTDPNPERKREKRRVTGWCFGLGPPALFRWGGTSGMAEKDRERMRWDMISTPILPHPSPLGRR